MQLLCINRGGINGDRCVELSCKRSQIRVSTTHPIAPATNGFDFGMPFERRNYPVFVRSIGQPNGIIEIVNYLFSKDAKKEPLDHRRAQRKSLTVNKNKMIARHIKENQEPPGNAPEETECLLKISSLVVKIRPGLYVPKRGQIEFNSS